jgi:hypothetical protein
MYGPAFDAALELTSWIATQSPRLDLFGPVFDAVLELASGVIAVVISLEAARARSFSKERIFLALETSFALLGASNILRGALVLLAFMTAGPIVLVRPFSWVGDLLQAIIAAIAYAILLWVQIRDSLSGPSVLPQIGLALVIPSVNILNVFMLVTMTVIIFARFLRERNVGQALVALGFLLLACAHLSNVLGYRDTFLLMIENVLRLGGYLSLLAMLLKVRQGT